MVDVSSLTHFHDGDGLHVIFDRVNDPVRTLPDAIAILARELFASRWTRILGQGFDSRNDSAPIAFLRNALNLSHSRRLDENPIFCHRV